MDHPKILGYTRKFYQQNGFHCSEIRVFAARESDVESALADLNPHRWPEYCAKLTELHARGISRVYTYDSQILTILGQLHRGDPDDPAAEYCRGNLQFGSDLDEIELGAKLTKALMRKTCRDGRVTYHASYALANPHAVLDALQSLRATKTLPPTVLLRNTHLGYVCADVNNPEFVSEDTL